MVARAGFTLVEFAITLALIAVLASLAAPSFRSTILQNRLSNEINGFVADQRRAQSEAIDRNTSVAMCTSTNGTACDATVDWEDGWIVFVDADGDGVVDAGEEILRVGAALGDNRTLRAAGAAADAVSYSPTGDASNGGTFVLCNDNDLTEARALFISASGRIRLFDRDTDGVPVDDNGDAITTCTPS